MPHSSRKLTEDVPALPAVHVPGSAGSSESEIRVRIIESEAGRLSRPTGLKVHRMLHVPLKQGADLWREGSGAYSDNPARSVQIDFSGTQDVTIMCSPLEFEAEEVPA